MEAEPRGCTCNARFDVLHVCVSKDACALSWPQSVATRSHAEPVVREGMEGMCTPGIPTHGSFEQPRQLCATTAALSNNSSFERAPCWSGSCQNGPFCPALARGRPQHSINLASTWL